MCYKVCYSAKANPRKRFAYGDNNGADDGNRTNKHLSIKDLSASKNRIIIGIIAFIIIRIRCKKHILEIKVCYKVCYFSAQNTLKNRLKIGSCFLQFAVHLMPIDSKGIHIRRMPNKRFDLSIS